MVIVRWRRCAPCAPQPASGPLTPSLSPSEGERVADPSSVALGKAKGYAYRYVFAEGAGHTDGRATRQTLPGALEWLWEGYPQ